MILMNFFKKNILTLILIFYFIIASAGIFFNYSLFNTTGDEAPLLSATLKIIADHSFRPNYPSFYHLGLGAYLYLPFFLIYLLLMRLSGLFPDIEAIKQFGQVDFAKFLPLGRFISVLSGLACLYLLYKICEKIFNNRLVSLLATFFLSVSFLFVQTSHFARIWIPQTLTVLLAFYFIIKLYKADKGWLKDYLLCGLGIGLAFGMHVVGVFVYASFLIVHYLKNKKEKIKKIIFSKYFWSANLLFSIVYFIVYYLNIYGFTRYVGGIFPNLKNMVSISATLGKVVSRTELLSQDSSNTISQHLVYYLKALWLHEPLLLIFTIFGSIILFIKKKDIFLIIYSFIVFYFLAISSIGAKIDRYMLPSIPFMAIISAYGLTWLYENIKYKKIVGSLIGLVCFLLLYPPLLWDYKFILPSSRLEAANWVYNNLPPGESIINFDNHLELNENRQTLLDIKNYSQLFTKKRVYLLDSKDEIFPKPNYYIFTYLYYEKAPPEIINKKFNYLIISWLDKKNYDYWLGKLNDLNLSPDNLTLVKRFPANATFDDIGLDMGGDIYNPLATLPKLKQNGPIVDIYEIK